MARTRIYRAAVKVKTQAMATRLIEQVIYELHFGATVRTRGGPYSTGNLADSMYRLGPIVTGDRVSGRVGSRLRYARIVHDGAGVHPIFPKGARGQYRFGSRKRPQLKFFWRKAGQVVYMPHVPGSIGTVGSSHPGMRGKHYLVEPLIETARRHNMRVIVYDL